METSMTTTLLLSRANAPLSASFRAGTGVPARPDSLEPVGGPERPASQSSAAATASVRDGRTNARTAVLDRDALFAEFRPLVQRLLRQYGTEPEMRQDLQGEIYCQFCQHLEAFDPSRGVPLRPYLVRQLTASVYTYARGQWRRQKRETGLELWAETLHTCDPSRQWDQRLAQEQTAQRLPEAIAALPSRQRKVLIWRYYEERSFEEIASELSVQVATARSLLRHSLNNLRKSLGAATGECAA